ncbi:hypothetical protein B0H19DRAFT_1278914 [Mycena capillaripes]|nr:hypothetical protein B0H19DRAFT_1278914 [Mycena capillaripes]
MIWKVWNKAWNRAYAAEVYREAAAAAVSQNYGFPEWLWCINGSGRWRASCMEILWGYNVERAGAKRIKFALEFSEAILVWCGVCGKRSNIAFEQRKTGLARGDVWKRYWSWHIWTANTMRDESPGWQYDFALRIALANAGANIGGDKGAMANKMCGVTAITAHERTARRLRSVTRRSCDEWAEGVRDEVSMLRRDMRDVSKGGGGRDEGRSVTGSNETWVWNEIQAKDEDEGNKYETVVETPRGGLQNDEPTNRASAEGRN